MNAEPVRPGPGGEEDSWETLAEDLFGINLGADPAGSALVTPDDLSLDEPEDSPASAKTVGPGESTPISAARPEEKKTPPVAKPPAGRQSRAQASSAPRDDADFGADLDLDDRDVDKVAAETEESLFGDAEEEIAVGSEDGDRDSDSPTESASDEDDRGIEGEDTYWDTLKDWQWGEEDDDSRENRERSDRGGSRRGGGGRPRAGGDQRSGRGDRSGQRSGDRSGGRGGGRRPSPPGEQPLQSERPPARRRDERSESRQQNRPPERPTEHSRRPEPGPNAPPVETDDFGAGLLDDDSGRGSARTRDERSSGNVQHTDDEDAGRGESGAVENVAEGERHFDSERPPRRRRRRRRSRSRRESSAGPTEGEADVVDDEAVERDEEAPLSDEPDDESRSESSAETEREESGRPRRRRRRRRRGRSGEPGATQSRQEGSLDSEPARIENRELAKSSFEPPHDADDEDDDVENEAEVEEGEIDDEAPRVYRNVPTWEEAISYLLHNRQGEGRSRESDSGRPRDSRRD